MSDLSKQQLILLALLVSFVTSLATGIITVSLMDQAPQGVVQTITQVVDKTIQEAAAPAQDTTAAASSALSPQDALAASVAAVSQSVVQLRGAGQDNVSGLGLMVSDEGVILADRSSVAGLSGYSAVLPGGAVLPLSIIQSQNGGDLIFLASSATPSPGTASSTAFAPTAFGGAPELGQTVYALTGTSTLSLAQGIVIQYLPAATSTAPSSVPASLGVIVTSMPSSGIVLGSPLFTADGSVIGIHTSSVPQASGAAFYSTLGIGAVIPAIQPAIQ